MQRYTPEQIEEFLAAIDRNLKKPAELIIIGGTAAALFYRFSQVTRDIDTANRVNELEDAITKARTETGFDIPVGPAGVFQAPYSYEDRLVPYQGRKLSKLRVKGPEAIDLILMKTARAEAHDIEAIRSIVQSQEISLEAIVERYRDDMGHVSIETNLLAVIESVFGEDSVATASKLLKKKNSSAKKN